MNADNGHFASLLLAVAVIASPAAAGFNDILQIICDEDNFVLTGCDVTTDGLEFVKTVDVSADNQHVYICSSLADPGSDPSPQAETLSAFSRSVDGTLTLVDQEIEGSGGVTTLASCRGVAVSPDGKHVYTAALTDSAVTWFARSTAWMLRRTSPSARTANYTVLAAGDVTFRGPRIVIGDGFGVQGTFVVDSAVP